MRKILFGISVAIFLWFLMFSPWTAQKVNFWAVMFIAGILLSSYSVLNDKAILLKKFNFTFRTFTIGLLSAILLYLVFYLGNFFINILFEASKYHVSSIYSIKSGSSTLLISFLILFIIGPAEEIFWRGFIQDNFQFFTKKSSFSIILTTFIYTSVHIWALNPILLIATMICGLFWGYLYYRYQSLGLVIVSHSIWDFLVFIVFPLS